MCGTACIDVGRLETTAEYEGPAEASHPVIQRFWAVVKTFSQRELAALLVFVWGRSRPPLPFSGDHLKVTILAVLVAASQALGWSGWARHAGRWCHVRVAAPCDLKLTPQAHAHVRGLLCASRRLTAVLLAHTLETAAAGGDRRQLLADRAHLLLHHRPPPVLIRASARPQAALRHPPLLRHRHRTHPPRRLAVPPALSTLRLPLLPRCPFASAPPP